MPGEPLTATVERLRQTLRETYIVGVPGQPSMEWRNGARWALAQLPPAALPPVTDQIEALRWAITSLENVRSVYPPGAEYWEDDRQQKLASLRDLAAALPPVAPDGADLGDAWAEAEAALPEGWGIEIVPNTTQAPARNGRWFARVVRDMPGIGRAARTGWGDTPLIALRELARRLRAGEGGPTATLDVDRLRCGNCGDELLPSEVRGHLLAEGRLMGDEDG